MAINFYLINAQMKRTFKQHLKQLKTRRFSFAYGLQEAPNKNFNPGAKVNGTVHVGLAQTNATS